MELRRVGQGCVLGCERARGLPTRLLCVLVLVGQAAVLDYYLIAFTSLASAAWLLVDAINIVLVVATLVVSLSRERSAQSGEAPKGFVRRFKSMAWFAWFVYGSTVAVKTITLFRANIVAQLGETDVVGKNLLKTAIAGSGCLFLLLLLTQHPASPASQTGRCLQDLTGTVLFDILDTVDMLEILFEAGGREKAGLGAEVVPLLLATINLAAPSIPLLTLVDTNFGQRRLSRRVVVIHKVATTLVVNVPNLLLRMVFWTRFSVGVSPFILKNFVMVALALYEAYEHLRGTVVGAAEGEEGEGEGEEGGEGRRGSRIELGHVGSSENRSFSDLPYGNDRRAPSPRRQLRGVVNEGFLREVTL